MNDFERKLAAQTFRTPPADLRRTVLAACELPPRRTWCEWLWPSPVAWGALAALWLLFFAIDAVERPPAQMAPVRHSRPSSDEQALRASPLLAGHSPEALRHVLELTR